MSYNFFIGNVPYEDLANFIPEEVEKLERPTIIQRLHDDLSGFNVISIIKNNAPNKYWSWEARRIGPHNLFGIRTMKWFGRISEVQPPGIAEESKLAESFSDFMPANGGRRKRSRSRRCRSARRH
jgi:hypothetical protein